MISVLMHIEWRHRYGWNAFRLNTSVFSAMPHEKEVLLQDGAKFDILDIIDNHSVTNKQGQL